MTRTKTIPAISFMAAVLFLTGNVSATVVPPVDDSCNQETTYLKTSGILGGTHTWTNDSRVLIKTENTGSAGNPDRITVNAQSGYQVVSVKIELSNNNTAGWDVVLGSGDLNSYNPSGDDIEQYEVVVKKVCTPQETCAEQNGFWNGDSCEEIPSCSDTETYNAETNQCDQNEVPPTEEEVCTDGGGYWNGDECEDIPTCGDNESYNAETNSCDPQETGGDDEEVGGGDEETPPTEDTPPASSSSSSKGSSGGGGGMCHPNTGYPECQGEANYRFHGLTPPTGGDNPVLKGKMKELIDALTKLLKLLSAEPVLFDVKR